MSLTPSDDAMEPDGAAEIQADAMKDQLRKDVASWSASRSEGATRQAAELSVATAKQPAPQPAKRVRRAIAAKPKIEQTSAAKKPFSMSYDGVTQADYITYMITRGAR
jgi:hypothetical protein